MAIATGVNEWVALSKSSARRMTIHTAKHIKLTINECPNKALFDNDLN